MPCVYVMVGSLLVWLLTVLVLIMPWIVPEGDSPLFVITLHCCCPYWGVWWSAGGDVKVHPPLQPLTGETLRFDREDEARVDVSTRRLFLMPVKCLMLMPPHTVVPRYHHSIEGLNVRSRESMNNVLERWRWDHLPLLCFPHLVVWVMRLQKTCLPCFS